jgi:hypothetical protein
MPEEKITKEIWLSQIGKKIQNLSKIINEKSRGGANCIPIHPTITNLAEEYSVENNVSVVDALNIYFSSIIEEKGPELKRVMNEYIGVC